MPVAGRESVADGSVSSGGVLSGVPELHDLDPADPWDAYRRILGPPLLTANGKIVLVTRFADCHEALQHPELSIRRKLATGYRGTDSPFFFHWDPPAHTKTRTLVTHAFTGRRAEALRPWLETQVHEALDRHPFGAPLELISELAYPVPVNAISEMLGIPAEARADMMRWSRAISLGGDVMTRRSREDQVNNRVSIRESRRYLIGLIRQRRAEPRDDLLSRLVAAEVDGERLSDKEIYWLVLGLMITGHETTVSLIGHAMAMLLRHPHLQEQVAQDDAFAEHFIEETLRHETPVQMAVRVAPKEVTLAGVAIPPGASLVLLLGAGNRDPERFDRPDLFDPGRHDRGHLAFGGGVHRCIGAPLSRLEGRVALRALAQRLVRPRLAPDGLAYSPKNLLMRTITRQAIEVSEIRPATH